MPQDRAGRATEAESGGVTARPSPVRAQYDALKREHPDCILLFQLGDFYETFEGDARVVARICDITLTSKEFGRGDRVPLAGVPVARAGPHIAKLLAAGQHVAICDQVSEAGRGLVERRVTRVITPGTVAEPGLIPATENNLLAAFRRGRRAFGLAHVDVTTGELLATTIPLDGGVALEAEVQRLQAAECLVAGDEMPPPGFEGHVTPFERACFDEGGAGEALRRLFGVSSLDGYGLADETPALGAVGALVAYLEQTNRPLVASLREPRTYHVGATMVLDQPTRRNLELVRSARGGQRHGSMLDALDRTRTAMGARRLRRALGQPLLDPEALERRLDAVEELVERPERRTRLRINLGRLGDLERLLGRVRQGTASTRDACGLARALRAVPELRDSLDGSRSDLLAELVSRLDDCRAVAELIDSALLEPTRARTIRPGYSAELDELVDGIATSRRWIAELERRERERTGIRSLRVNFNKIFGYSLEVTKPNLGQVPTDYVRRQTLVNAERFVTSELKEHEARILNAEARIEELERELFAALLRRVSQFAGPLVGTVEAVADLDLLGTFAELASERNWVRPGFAGDDSLVIEGGRHPVLEALLPAGEFVPNDCRLGSDGERPTPCPPERSEGSHAPHQGDSGHHEILRSAQDDISCPPVDSGAEGGRILLVTGPNMGGKSTYLRQVALIVLLAQVGSFVPARAARIGPVDRIFTRVGSQDDLASGASTFLVEMAETAAILRHATARSLVVLDEVGRGTSTHDGLCIAKAVIEHLHEVVGARTLFATHYHELTALAESLPGLRNVSVAVDDGDDRLAFLYRVVDGAADRSYGVQVARLAGLPATVTDRAADLLRQREGSLHGRGGAASSAPTVGALLAAPRREGDLPPLKPEDQPAASADGVLAELAIRESAPAYMPERVSSNGLPDRDDGLDGAVLDGAASRLLGDLLAIDLSGVTPLQALNLLHEMQSSARASVPWREWLGGLTNSEHQPPKPGQRWRPPDLLP